MGFVGFAGAAEDRGGDKKSKELFTCRQNAEAKYKKQKASQLVEPKEE
jgi:hypothetical protein